MKDLVIIGGGPAGIAAGVYAARKKIDTTLIAESFGGQSIIASDIENWIGDEHISGYDLAKKMEAHVRSYKDAIEILDDDRVIGVQRSEQGFTIQTKSGRMIETRFILVASGGHHKRLGVPGEDTYAGKGVVYCATCDAPLFGGKDVVVVGGGNSGLEAARDLLPYAKHITLMVRSENIRGDQSTLDMLLASGKVALLKNALVEEIKGGAFVEGIAYKDAVTQEEKTLPVQGVFVEIGSTPNSDFVKDIVATDDLGRIIIDHKTQQTRTPGIWAAGDVTDALYRQNNISAGDGVKAILNINDTLHAQNKNSAA